MTSAPPVQRPLETTTKTHHRQNTAAFEKVADCIALNSKFKIGRPACYNFPILVQTIHPQDEELTADEAQGKEPNPL